MNKAAKIQIYPNKKQQNQIDITIGSVRFIWNQMLAERKAIYQELKGDKDQLYKHKYKTEKEYKEIFLFLKESSSRALQQSRMDLDIAYKNFFQSCKKGQKLSRRKDGELEGFPKFKKKGKDKSSYREPQIKNEKQTAINIQNNKLKLNKLGWVKISHTPEIDGEIKSVTIEKGKDGKYYASVLFELKRESRKLRTGNGIVGVDLGLKEFVTLSDGQIIKGIHKEVLEPINKKIDKTNQHLSRKNPGSNRHERQRLKLNRLYQKRGNIKSHFEWHLANHILRENQSVSIENLNISGMKKNRKLSQSIHNVSWYSFIMKLKQKAIEYGSDIFEVDRFFPSSKLCPECGNLKQDLKLSDRTYICDCGYSQDRDINASINLRNEYLRINNISLESSENGRGEFVKPKKIIFDLKGRFVEASTDYMEYFSI